MKIFVNGRAFSGKDTVVDIICENYTFNSTPFKRDSFASPIYDICREYLGMENKNREYLIQVGQKMREIEPNVWINHLLKRNKDVDNLVVSDVRQANEFIALSQLDYVSIRVKSTLENRIARCKARDGFEPTQEDIDLWESEGEVGADDFEYDYEIDNDGTYEELVEKVDEIMRELGATKELDVGDKVKIRDVPSVNDFNEWKNYIRKLGVICEVNKNSRNKHFFRVTFIDNDLETTWWAEDELERIGE